MSFYNGSTLLGTANVASGAASLVTSGLTASTMTVTAVYSGNNSFATSTSAAQSITVRAATGTTTTTTFVVSPNPPTAGQATTFTATMTPAPTGSSLGTVSFYNGSTLLGTGSVNAAGLASTSLPAA